MAFAHSSRGRAKPPLAAYRPAVRPHTELKVRLGWLSDIHLNFLDKSRLCEFLNELALCRVDGWLLGGDIGEATSLLTFLRQLEAAVPVPTYFVLGNHDFYGSSLAGVKAQVGAYTRDSERLIWLSASEPQVLDGDVTVVGDDSWADARFGDAKGTPVELNDFYLIEELSGLSRGSLVRTLNQLGDESAARLRPKLNQASELHRHVVVLTHVPPFREAAWHQGQPSSDEYLPWFSCRAMGEAILDCASSRPETGFLVLCGHTHGSGVCSPARNVTVLTAEAEYGSPHVQRIFEFP